MSPIQPKALLFDFDGVIADSEELHYQALLSIAKPYGHDFSRQDYDRELLGFDDRGAFQHLWFKHKQKLTPEELQKLVLKKNKLFHQFITQGVPVFPGVHHFIKQLQVQKIPMGIVSGALEDEIQVCLKHANLQNEFQFVVAANHVQHSKPDPECYESGFAKMQKLLPDLDKSDCWVIEDSPAGIRAARRANLPVIGITHSFKKDQLHEATLIVDKFEEIAVAQFDFK